jgi:hypothetical protein
MPNDRLLLQCLAEDHNHKRDDREYWWDERCHIGQSGAPLEDPFVQSHNWRRNSEISSRAHSEMELCESLVEHPKDFGQFTVLFEAMPPNGTDLSWDANRRKLRAIEEVSVRVSFLTWCRLESQTGQCGASKETSSEQSSDVESGRDR